MSNPTSSSLGWRRLLSTPTPVLFLASIAIAIVVVGRSGAWTSIGEAVRQLSWQTVALALVLYGAGLLLLSFRWHALARMAGATAAPQSSTEVFLTSVMVNYAAPIGLAVPMRTALTTRDLGLPVGTAAGVTLWEALLDLATLAAIGTLWIAVAGLDAARLLITNGGTWLKVLGVVALVVLVLVLALSLLVRRVRRRVGEFLAAAVSMARRNPRWWCAAAAITIIFWAIQLLVLRLLLVGFGQPPPSLEALFGLTGWPVLIGMISPVPGGAGVREALMVAVASATRLDTAVVLLTAVAYRMALFVMLPILYAGARWWGASNRSRAAAHG